MADSPKGRPDDTYRFTIKVYISPPEAQISSALAIYDRTTQCNWLCYNCYRRSQIGYNLTGRHRFTVLITPLGGSFAGYG